MTKHQEKESFKARLKMQYDLYQDEKQKGNRDAMEYHLHEIHRLETTLSYMQYNQVVS